MRTTTSTPPTLYFTDGTGFYARDTADGIRIHRVRWNRRHTARYAEALLPPTTRNGRRAAELAYRGQAPLHDLTPADALSPAHLLRHLAAHGPYDACLFCRRPLEDDLPRAFGVGRDCAGRHLDLGPVALRVIYHRLDPPPDGGQTPSAPARGHLHLVAANGRLIEAA